MKDDGRKSRHIFRITTLVTVLSVTGSLALTPPTHAYQRPGKNVLVTADVSGMPIQGDDSDIITENAAPFLSGDGRFVTFASAMPDLAREEVTPQAAGRDVFLRDLSQGLTTVVSVSSTGQQGVGTCPIGKTSGKFGTDPGSRTPVLGKGGRFIVFESCAVNLVPGDTNLAADIFVRDQKIGRTWRASLASDGTEATLSSHMPSVSASGRYVTFYSKAPNIVEPDPNPLSDDVFVHDNKTGLTTLVATDENGRPLSGSSTWSSIDDTGRYVAFKFQPPLTPQSGEQSLGIVNVKDLESGKLETVSVDLDGQPVYSDLYALGDVTSKISSGGRYVAFYSTRNTLVPNDSNTFQFELFVRDRQTDRTYRVNVSSAGEEMEYDNSTGDLRFATHGAVMTSNGRYAVFSSPASNFVAHDEVPSDPLCQIIIVGCDSDVFTYDLETGATTIMSVDTKGQPHQCGEEGSGAAGTYTALYSTASATGRYIGFLSCGNELVEDYTYKGSDLQGYVRDQGPPLDVGSVARAQGVSVGGPQGLTQTGRIETLDRVDDLGPTLTERGANLYEVSLAYRPQHDDLFVAVDLEHMPQVLPGPSPIFYGVRFSVETKSYEVRATSLLGGTFGLFDCTEGVGQVCEKVVNLRGGYGTTGERVVLSLPLDEIGLEDGGEVRNVEAFSAIGDLHTGAVRILDTVELR